MIPLKYLRLGLKSSCACITAPYVQQYLFCTVILHCYFTLTTRLVSSSYNLVLRSVRNKVLANPATPTVPMAVDTWREAAPPDPTAKPRHGLVKPLHAGSAVPLVNRLLRLRRQPRKPDYNKLVPLVYAPLLPLRKCLRQKLLAFSACSMFAAAYDLMCSTQVFLLCSPHRAEEQSQSWYEGPHFWWRGAHGFIPRRICAS